jgi:hypothetical protein
LIINGDGTGDQVLVGTATMASAPTSSGERQTRSAF